MSQLQKQKRKRKMAPRLTAKRPASLSSRGRNAVLQLWCGSEKWRILQSHRRLPGGVRCSSGSPDSGGGGAPPLVRAAKGDEGGGGAELDSPRSVDDVVAVLEADYQRAYFLTGNFTPDIYTEDCLFEDPTIKFRGRSRYSQNLDLLVPFFDSPSLELENIEKGLRVETKFIMATWTLRTYLRLPWRPLIAIRGNTTYDLDEEYKVTRHAESWDVSALEAIGQIFVPAPKQTDDI
uniref:Uncharacterized protein n=2 Tax=Oryza TaxID=4527 RepID=A0A0D3GNH8_9ORYZ